MCAFMDVMVTAQKLSKRIGETIHELDLKKKIKFSARGFVKTEKVPVLYVENKQLRYSEMNWSLCPPWAKEYPIKWSTYNARMTRESKKGGEEKIYDVATFRDSFKKNKFCLVPMSSAFEFCYWGKLAGMKAKFTVKDDEIFLPVGLWSEWIAEDGEVVETCTLLTDNPYKFFFEMGHDRSIVVLEDTMALELLYDRKMDHEEKFKFIRDYRITQDWVAEGVSPMKEGWEKRVPSKEEISAIKRTVF